MEIERNYATAPEHRAYNDGTADLVQLLLNVLIESWRLARNEISIETVRNWLVARFDEVAARHVGKAQELEREESKRLANADLDPKITDEGMLLNTLILQLRELHAAKELVGGSNKRLHGLITSATAAADEIRRERARQAALAERLIPPFDPAQAVSMPDTVLMLARLQAIHAVLVHDGHKSQRLNAQECDRLIYLSMTDDLKQPDLGKPEAGSASADAFVVQLLRDLDTDRIEKQDYCRRMALAFLRAMLAPPEPKMKMPMHWPADVRPVMVRNASQVDPGIAYKRDGVEYVTCRIGSAALTKTATGNDRTMMAGEIENHRATLDRLIDLFVDHAQPPADGMRTEGAFAEVGHGG